MPESFLTKILDEYQKGKSPSRKRYKKFRKVVVTDDFNTEAINFVGKFIGYMSRRSMSLFQNCWYVYIILL